MFFSGLIFYNHKTTFPEIAEIAFLENILKRAYDYSCSLPSYISLSMAVSVFLVGRGFLFSVLNAHESSRYNKLTNYRDLY